MLELPQPEDGFDEKILADIRSYGWSCILVADKHHPEHRAQNAALGPDPVYDATFAYSVGLWQTYEHPEIVLVGPWEHAHGIVSSAVSCIAEGARFQAGDRTNQVLEGYDVCFESVAPKAREGFLTFASWLNFRQPFEALQLVVPDVSGLWPWDPGYEDQPQPLLR